ncbi:MAG TPA: hypothetical protein VGF85_11535 [Opitutaceae bacterium]
MTPADDNLDELLRNGLRTPALPCEGFDRRVTAALPRPHSCLPLYPILLWLGGLSAATGLGIGLRLFGSQMDAADRAGAWMSANTLGPWSGASFAVAVASCLYAGWAARAAFGGFRPPVRR